MITSPYQYQLYPAYSLVAVRVGSTPVDDADGPAAATYVWYVHRVSAGVKKVGMDLLHEAIGSLGAKA